MSDEDAETLFQRADAMAKLLESLDSFVPTMAISTAELEDEEAGEASNEADFVWLSSVNLAKERGLSLWCDDARLRDIARAESVSTFGSMALIHALAEVGRISGATVGIARGMLIFERYVGGDFELQPARHAAALAGWFPQGAAHYLLKSDGTPNPASHVSFALEAIQNSLADPTAMEGWSFAFAGWLLRVSPPPARLANLIAFLGQLLRGSWMGPSTLPFVLNGIRSAMTEQEFEEGDPFEQAIKGAYIDYVKTSDYITASGWLTFLVSSAAESDRQAATLIMLKS